MTKNTFLLLALLPTTAIAAEDPRTLVFAALQWEGKFTGFSTMPVRCAIHTVREDGTELRELVSLGGDTTNPKFSPDGKWLYFQSNASGHYQVYRCQADGSDVTNVSAIHPVGQSWKEAYGYALSGDGLKLVYTVHDGREGRVVIGNADGSDARFVAPHLGYIYMAALNRAGDQIVFSGPAREYRLFIADLPAGEPRLLTPDHPESFVPQFTPDGKTIVFIRRDGDVYRVDVDGRNLRRLTNGNQYVQFRLSGDDKHGSTDGPDISSDSQRIAYIAVKDGVPQVCTMNLDGNDQCQVTSRKTPCGRVKWSPNGRRVAFVSFEGDYPQMFVIDAAGGSPNKLTDAKAAVYWVDWHRSTSMGR